MSGNSNKKIDNSLSHDDDDDDDDDDETIVGFVTGGDEPFGSTTGQFITDNKSVRLNTATSKRMGEWRYSSTHS
jgi:hypothetical protein